ncbi:MAG: cytochrome c oxidase subunit II [Pseudomonadota bacterium]
MQIVTRFFLSLFVLLAAGPAFAAGLAVPGQIGFQDPATPVMERLVHFHNAIFILIAIITVFVFLLMVWVAVRYNARANPEPATFTHNTKLEIAWTVIPTAIVLGIMYFSLPMLFYTEKIEKPDMTLKVTGYQWNWGFEYPDYDGLSFTAIMIPSAEIDTAQGQKRNLSVDNIVVLPTDTNIQVLVTAADVLHSFAVPAFGIKVDAVPGRLNESWIRITKPGVYYGQCSELCGKDHAFMPVEVHAVPKAEFEAWVATAKQKFAAAPPRGSYSIAFTE